MIHSEADSHKRIPIAVSLDENFVQKDLGPNAKDDKVRLLYISAIAIVIAVFVSFISKLLVYIINLITNISFHHQFSILNGSPATNNYGIWVVFVPAVGGFIVGLMALYGSSAIRGHGIPEAMEQILTNKSKIRPSITYLKPVSAAISIGTGGPFGAEGPIIATGGALGSTIGQILKISPYERKILLAAGATSGMSAIFGSPIAAIFLAIELLLFEFSPRSIVPVALACITGAAGHHLLFGSGPVFPSATLPEVTNTALVCYSVIGIIMGLISAAVTKIVYFIEDAFEKLPVHWMWWPMIGGFVVGIVGYFFPRTLGVGYENITDLLSGNMPVTIVVSLCVFKFISWVVALGSGTSGGTLAPLLTIGGAVGALLGTAIMILIPKTGISISMAVLIGMSAMFAGASRALLTSIVFAVETTGQPHALLPLLAACLASYIVSYFLMKNTIMTEKIARRGVVTPHAYEPDILDKVRVRQVLKEGRTVISADLTLTEVRSWLSKRKEEQRNYYVVANEDGAFRGIVSSSSLFSLHHNENDKVGSLIKRKVFAVNCDDHLKKAVEMMSAENLDVLPVVSSPSNTIAGLLTYSDILSAYRHHFDEHDESVSISLKRKTMKILIHGKRRLSRKMF
jgi:CIC family chloride channel protein